jgi:hypothetical protein
MGVQIPHPEQKCTIVNMSITKAQLDAINSGILDRLGISQSEANAVMGGSVLGEALANTATAIIKELEKDIRAKKLTASKSLLQNIDPTNYVETANGVTLAITMVNYYQWVEDGRKRGRRPPIASIEEWITRKGIQVRKSKGESKQSVLERRRSMAIAIANKIAAKGTIKRFGYKGGNFIKDVLTPQTIEAIAGSIGDIIGRQVQVFVTTEVTQ